MQTNNNFWYNVYFSVCNAHCALFISKWFEDLVNLGKMNELLKCFQKNLPQYWNGKFTKFHAFFSVLQLTDLFSDFHGAILIFYEKRDDGRIPDKPINSNSTNPSLAIGKFTTDHGYIRSLPVWHTHPVSSMKYIICQISITYIWWTLPSCVKYIMNHSRWKYSPRLIYHCWLIWFAKSNESMSNVPCLIPFEWLLCR